MSTLFMSLWSWLFYLFMLTSATNFSTSRPTATVKNGTYLGKFVPEWKQDMFLGVPYAIPPLGDLRFAWPKSLNSSFGGVRDATEYGFSCYQYATTFKLSEDCLNLNGIMTRRCVLKQIFG